MYILSSTIKASNFVTGVDNAFMLILGISFFFLIALTLVMVYFVYKYNNKKNPVATQIEGSTKLEIIWTGPQRLAGSRRPPLPPDRSGNDHRAVADQHRAGLHV